MKLNTFIFSFLFLFTHQLTFGQGEPPPPPPASEVPDSLNTDSTEIFPFHVVEKLPIYPGCEEAISFSESKKCLNKKISRFVVRQFNTDLSNELGLSGRQRIISFFVIDEYGKVIDVKARANHPKLEDEAIRIISKLPEFIPAVLDGKNVSIKYALPITFVIED